MKNHFWGTIVKIHLMMFCHGRSPPPLKRHCMYAYRLGGAAEGLEEAVRGVGDKVPHAAAALCGGVLPPQLGGPQVQKQ